MQPLLLFSSPGAGKCNPSNCFEGLGLEHATPPAVFKLWDWKMQPLLLFSSPGAGKCNPSCCFQALGLDSATPPPVFKPWGWKLEFEATVISVYDEPCTSYVLMPQASGSQYPPGLPQECPKGLLGPPITPQGLPETPGRRPGGLRDAPGSPPGSPPGPPGTLRDPSNC